MNATDKPTDLSPLKQAILKRAAILGYSRFDRRSNDMATLVRAGLLARSRDGLRVEITEAGRRAIAE